MPGRGAEPVLGQFCALGQSQPGDNAGIRDGSGPWDNAGIWDGSGIWDNAGIWDRAGPGKMPGSGTVPGSGTELVLARGGRRAPPRARVSPAASTASLGPWFRQRPSRSVPARRGTAGRGCRELAGTAGRPWLEIWCPLVGPGPGPQESFPLDAALRNSISVSVWF